MATGGSAAAVASADAASPEAAAAPTSKAADVQTPRVRAVALSGVDADVLRAAPAPEPDAGHEHGGVVGQSDVGGSAVEAEDLKVAVASTVSSTRRPASLVAVSADAAFAAGTSIQVRVLQADGWSDWESLVAQDGHGPDPGTAEAQGIRAGSEPLMTVDATEVQIRIDTPSGRVPDGTRLEVISAPTAASDATSAAQTESGAAVSSSGVTAQAAAAPRPTILTRAQWGANESWRGRAPIYTGAIRAGFLHHTASTSNYTPAQTPAKIRAIYAYHTRSLGHSDIDYNFIVDRFGRLWEGRYGGIDKPVLGGHTAGFNANTFAVVGLGNFQSTAPAAANLAKMKDSLGRLFAWKLGIYGVSPVSTARLTSAGYTKPTRYPKGTVAAIPAISSHQTVNYTACPGQYLQRALPGIRTLAAKYAHVVITPPVASPSTLELGTRDSVAVTARADRAVTWRADIVSPCATTPVRSYTGRTSAAGPIAFRWNLRDAKGKAQLPAAYAVRITGLAKDGSTVLPVAASIVISPTPGGAWGPCVNVTRVAGADAATTSVLWGRTFAPRSRTVVLTAPATEGEAALAAGVVAGPLARHLRVPLLLTPRSGLASSVAADLRVRKATHVIVVGSASVVPAAVVKAVQKLGVAVTRLAGATPVETAVAVATRFPAGRPAMLVSPGSAPAHALSGSALAGLRDGPVLLTGKSTIPAATRKALAARASVTVAVPDDLSDATIAGAVGRGVPWVRLAGADEVAASIAIGSAAPSALQRVVLLPASPSAWGSAPLAASVGTPLLFTGGTTLPTATGTFLDSRASLRAGLTPVARTALTDSVLGAASRLLAGVPWAPAGSVAVYKVSRANASPEPVAKGARLTVKAKVRVSGGAGVWRKAPVGTAVTVEHRAAGTSTYRAVTTVRLTTAGKARVPVTATGTGRWRLVVAGTVSKSDHVRVRP